MELPVALPGNETNLFVDKGIIQGNIERPKQVVQSSAIGKRIHGDARRIQIGQEIDIEKSASHFVMPGHLFFQKMTFGRHWYGKAVIVSMEESIDGLRRLLSRPYNGRKARLPSFFRFNNLRDEPSC